MARQLRIEYEGALYHVISRGNEKKAIYTDDKDRNKFLEYIELCHERFGIKIHAYCLMSNHYHLLIETPRANLSRSMQQLNTSYTIYFNLKHKRAGHLFQGRYKAILVEKDEYLLELSRYIHLNPVRAGIAKRPEEYLWSSYKYFLSKGGQIPEYLEREATMSYFKQEKDYKEFVNAGIGDKLNDLSLRIVSGCLLGNEEFVAQIKEKYLGEEKRLDDLPGLKELNKKKFEEAEMIKLIRGEDTISDKDKKKIIIYFLRKFSDKTLRDIAGEYFQGQSISGVNKIVMRLEARIREDKKFAGLVAELELKMSNVKV